MSISELFGQILLTHNFIVTNTQLLDATMKVLLAVGYMPVSDMDAYELILSMGSDKRPREYMSTVNYGGIDNKLVKLLMTYTDDLQKRAVKKERKSLLSKIAHDVNSTYTVAATVGVDLTTLTTKYSDIAASIIIAIKHMSYLLKEVMTNGSANTHQTAFTNLMRVLYGDDYTPSSTHGVIIDKYSAGLTNSFSNSLDDYSPDVPLEKGDMNFFTFIGEDSLTEYITLIIRKITRSHYSNFTSTEWATEYLAEKVSDYSMQANIFSDTDADLKVPAWSAIRTAGSAPEEVLIHLLQQSGVNAAATEKDSNWNTFKDYMVSVSEKNVSCQSTKTNYWYHEQYAYYMAYLLACRFNRVDIYNLIRYIVTSGNDTIDGVLDLIPDTVDTESQALIGTAWRRAKNNDWKDVKYLTYVRSKSAIGYLHLMATTLKD